MQTLTGLKVKRKSRFNDSCTGDMSDAMLDSNVRGRRDYLSTKDPTVIKDNNYDSGK